jgi:hypothetical protein
MRAVKKVSPKDTRGQRQFTGTKYRRRSLMMTNKGRKTIRRSDDVGTHAVDDEGGLA